MRMVEPNSFGGFQLGYNARDGAVEGSLPNGHYVFLLTANGPQPGFALATVNVDGAPVQTTTVAIVPAGTIAVRVHTQFTQQDTQSDRQINSFSGPVGRTIRQDAQIRPLVQLLLRAESAGPAYASSNNQTGSADELTLQNVPPGSYSVRTQPLRGYVASISSGGVDLLQQPLVVSAGGTAAPIDITLRDDSATLTGTVTAGNGPLPPQSYILILPTDPSAQISYGVAGPDGKFTVPNLVPGSYRVFALRGQFRLLPYRDAEAMRPYDGKGTTITATPGQQLSADVPLLDDTEAEAN
jgi:hypothetical protein